MRSTSDAEPELKLISVAALKPEVIDILPNSTGIESLNQKSPNGQRSYTWIPGQPDVGKESG